MIILGRNNQNFFGGGFFIKTMFGCLWLLLCKSGLSDKTLHYFLLPITVNRNWNKTTKVAFLSEVQNLFVEKYFASCVMVASLFSMLFKCLSSWREGVSSWLMICHNDTQKMFSHLTLVLESELSNVLETYTRAAWLLNLLTKKKNQPKPIIRTGVIVRNVQKCVMAATFTLYVIVWEKVPLCRTWKARRHLFKKKGQSIRFSDFCWFW